MSEENTMDSKYITTEEMAKDSGVTPGTIDAWIRKGRIKSYKMTRKSIQVMRSDYEAFKNNCARGGQ